MTQRPFQNMSISQMYEQRNKENTGSSQANVNANNRRHTVRFTSFFLTEDGIFWTNATDFYILESSSWV